MKQMLLVLLALAFAAQANADGAPASSAAVTRQPDSLATAQPMTLQQANDFALAHNPVVLKAEAQVADAAAVLARDRAATLPTVSGQLQNQMSKSANTAGQFAQIGVSLSPTFSQNTAALRASFNGLNLVNLYQARSDKQAFDQASQQLFLTREQSTLDVETSFYKVAQLAQLAQIARENVNYNRVLLEVAKVNFRAGKVAGLDQLKAQVTYTSALEQLASATADQEDARENLAQTRFDGHAIFRGASGLQTFRQLHREIGTVSYTHLTLPTICSV